MWKFGKILAWKCVFFLKISLYAACEVYGIEARTREKEPKKYESRFLSHFFILSILFLFEFILAFISLVAFWYLVHFVPLCPNLDTRFKSSYFWLKWPFLKICNLQKDCNLHYQFWHNRSLFHWPDQNDWKGPIYIWLHGLYLSPSQS